MKFTVSNYFLFNVYMCIKTKDNFPVLFSIHMAILEIMKFLKVISLEMTNKASTGPPRLIKVKQNADQQKQSDNDAFHVQTR